MQLAMALCHRLIKRKSATKVCGSIHIFLLKEIRLALLFASSVLLLPRIQIEC